MQPPPPPSITLRAVLRHRVPGWPCLAVWMVAHHPRWGGPAVVALGVLLALLLALCLGLFHIAWLWAWGQAWPHLAGAEPPWGLWLKAAVLVGPLLWLVWMKWPRWQSRFHRQLAAAKHAQVQAQAAGSTGLGPKS
jgi:hypothetical protein